ncbi:MAG: signal recognition particle-docking protein FtsY [Propionibacteriaceae bacterium]|nr:signal recognition particle-docking protein FtsY [Propionibacteriaceae bacterium]
MAAVALVLVVAGVTIVVGRRKALPPAPPVPQLPAEAAQPAAAGRPVEAPGAEPAAGLDIPEPAASRLSRLRRRLSASNNPFARGLLGLLAADRLDAEAWEDLEATLITSDLGVGPTDELITALRRETAIDGVSDPAKARQVLRAELLKLIGPDEGRALQVTGADGKPGVVLVVGVNGTGKTTTIGKLARVLVAEGNSVVLAAADTFRAAAADQLQTWGARVGVPVVRGPEGGDPASVAHDAVETGIRDGVDVVVVDTAGRLHTKTGLMDELGKIKRVIGRLAPVTEVLLVIDATTGQNGLAQARVFAEVVDVTGIVLSKLDGSAKGGIVVPVQRELGVPVKLIGLGEGADDLAPFEAEGFVDALLGEG